MKEENKIEREREMENGGGKKVWKFRAKGELASEAHVSIRGMLEMIKGGLDGGDERPIIPLGHGDPSGFTFFRTISTAEDAVVSALRSGKYNCYSPSVGLLPARRAIAEHLSQDLPYKLSSNDVFITNGCTQAIETVMTVLAHPNANILLPRPGFPMYEARAVFCGIQVRHFDLLPHRNWEMDLDAVEGLVDDNTVAIVIINPGNPCGNVFSYHHLSENP